MKLIILAGINANPTDRINTIKIPLIFERFDFSFSVTGNGALITLNLKFGLPVAYLRIASYIN